MSTYDLHPFGEINLKAVEACYEGEIEFQARNLEVDLNFDKEKVSEKKLEVVRSMIEHIDQLDLNNKKYIQDDFKDESEDVTRNYIDFHLNEIGSEKLSGLIDINDTSISKEEQLLSKLHLVRVGFYPESREHFAVFDYTIGQDLTDYIVVINVDIKSKIHCMTQES